MCFYKTMSEQDVLAMTEETDLNVPLPDNAEDVVLGLHINGMFTFHYTLEEGDRRFRYTMYLNRETDSWANELNGQVNENGEID